MFVLDADTRTVPSHRPSPVKAQLFASIVEHYSKNYNILYALHREKPDYGLRSVLPTADRVFKVLRKLPQDAMVADEQISTIQFVVEQASHHCCEDRARQQETVEDFIALEPAEKLEIFEEYMRTFNYDFIEWVNGPRGKTMSQQHFNACLEDFRVEFLRVIAGIIEWDKYYWDDDDPELVAFDQVVELAQQRRNAADVRRGWIEALGLDPAMLSDEDIQSEPERDRRNFAALVELDRKRPTQLKQHSQKLNGLSAEIDQSG